MTALIVIISIVAYLMVGALVARSAVPALWARALKQWKYLESAARGDVVGGAVVRALFWPLMAPYEWLARSIDQQDPRERERRIQEQRRRIVELERELGIGDVNPECAAGKHPNCDATALDWASDEWIPCGCDCHRTPDARRAEAKATGCYDMGAA